MRHVPNFVLPVGIPLSIRSVTQISCFKMLSSVKTTNVGKQKKTLGNLIYNYREQNIFCSNNLPSRRDKINVVVYAGNFICLHLNHKFSQNKYFTFLFMSRAHVELRINFPGLPQVDFTLDTRIN